MNWLTVLLKKIQKPTWDFIIPSLVIASLLTFSPFDLRQRLGLERHYHAIQLYVSLLLLCSSAMFLYRAAALLIEKTRLKIQIEQNRRQITAFLKDISEREKKMLDYIWNYNSDAVWVPHYNPEVQSLLGKEIIYMLIKEITRPNEKDLPPYSDWWREDCAIVSVNPVVEEYLHAHEDTGKSEFE